MNGAWTPKYGISDLHIRLHSSGLGWVCDFAEAMAQRGVARLVLDSIGVTRNWLRHGTFLHISILLALLDLVWYRQR